MRLWAHRTRKTLQRRDAIHSSRCRLSKSQPHRIHRASEDERCRTTTEAQQRRERQRARRRRLQLQLMLRCSLLAVCSLQVHRTLQQPQLQPVRGFRRPTWRFRSGRCASRGSLVRRVWVRRVRDVDACRQSVFLSCTASYARDDMTSAALCWGCCCCSAALPSLAHPHAARAP